MSNSGALSAEPNAEQAALLQAIWLGYGLRRLWPTHDFVDRTLYRATGLSFPQVVSTLPSLQLYPSATYYRWVFAQADRIEAPQRDTPIGLTLAGMLHIPKAHQLAGLYLAVLGVLVQHEQNVNPDPTTVVDTSINMDDLLSILRSVFQGKAGRFDDFRQLSYSLLPQEPSTWHSHPLGVAPNGSVDLSPALRNFEGVGSLGEYVERVEDLFARTAQVEPAFESTMSIPEALDFLNVSWKLKHGDDLFILNRANPIAQTTFDCGTREEFMARLSGLWSVLTQANVPETTDTSLSALQQFLVRPQIGADLATADTELITEAVNVLRSVGQLRAAQQHFGSSIDQNERRAIRTIGLVWPPLSRSETWSVTRRRIVWALNIIRDTVA